MPKKRVRCEPLPLEEIVVKSWAKIDPNASTLIHNPRTPGPWPIHKKAQPSIAPRLLAFRSVESPMSHEPTVARCQVEITNSLGLHLRPADKFVKLASTFTDTDVKVRYQGREFNGKSILELALLAAECGTKLDLEARGPEAEAAVAALAELVLAKFHETEGDEPGSDCSSTEDPSP